MSYTHAYSTSCNYSQPIKMLVGVLKSGELVNYKNFTAGLHLLTGVLIPNNYVKMKLISSPIT